MYLIGYLGFVPNWVQYSYTLRVFKAGCNFATWDLLDGEILNSLIVFRLLGIRSFHGCCKVTQKHKGFRSQQDGPS